MRIERILRDKGGSIVTVAPGGKVRDAVALLSRKRIGTVVIGKDGAAPVGILSERDVVREIGARGEACLDDPIESMMTRDPKCCAPGDTLDDVLQKMTDGRFRHMPVLEDGRMVGIVSIGDVVKARLSELSMERDALENMVTGY